MNLIPLLDHQLCLTTSLHGIIENEYSENERIRSGLCATNGEEWKHRGLQPIANSRWGPLSGRWSSETCAHMHKYVLIGSPVHV